MIGHSLRTCVVFDLGICLAYMMLENSSPVTSSSAAELVAPVIHGYNSVLPLTNEEFDSLYYLALVRCLQSALNGELAFRAEPWNPYLLTSSKKAWLTYFCKLQRKKWIGCGKHIISSLYKISIFVCLRCTLNFIGYPSGIPQGTMSRAP